MFTGYFAFSGTEIINTARTRAYVSAFTPGLWVDLDQCDPLGDALGETYHSPMQDQAPWYSPYNTASAEFLGLIPLAVQGLEGSTAQAAFTETTTNGGVPGRSRHASRSLRFSALAVATTEKGMDYGLSWLSDALGSAGCVDGDCGGGTLCFYAQCPDVCAIDDQTPTVPLDVTLSAGQVAEQTAGWQVTGTASEDTAGGQTVLEVTAERPSVSVMVDGLMPGTWYRLSARAAIMDVVNLDAALEVAVAGTAYRATVVGPGTTVALAPGPVSVTTFDFLAPDTQARVVLTGSSLLRVAALRVERVPGPAEVMSQSLLGDPLQATAWSATLPSGLETSYTYSFYGPSVTASGGDVGPGQLGLSRTVGGLSAGVLYRLNALTVSSSPVAVDVDGDVRSVTTTDSGGSRWTTVEFVATATRHTVSVHNAEQQDTDAEAAVVAVSHVRVDQVLGSDLPVVQVTEDLRTLRDVATVAAPRVVQTFGSDAAVLRRVEWGMRAGSPRVLGEAITVARSLPPAYAVVPQRTCSYGLQTLRNLVPNPSFEEGTTGWAASSSTLTNPSSSDPVVGTKVLRATASAANGPNVRSPDHTTTPGRTFTGSAHVRVSDPHNVRFRLMYYDGTERKDIALTEQFLTPTQGWVRMWATGHVPPDAQAVLVYVAGMDAGEWDTDQWVEIDAVMLNEGYDLPPYFDGSTSDAAWDGDAHASTSTWTPPAPLEAIDDPDCPPPPAPPRPPVIPDECLDVPDSWLRYVLEVPAAATQAALAAYPELTLVTADSAARGVRVRVYADPFSAGVRGLDECSWCGEFLLSYLPPNATMRVDAATRTVEVTTEGQTVRAANLLYGSDGGPMVWPELTCGVPYLVVIDLDADQTPLIDASLDIVPVI